MLESRMTRRSDDGLRPLLLKRIVDHTLGRSLEQMTLRGLATDLGVSTYNLVYHFGTRERLIAEIVRDVARRELGSQPNLVGTDLESYRKSVQEYGLQAISPETLTLRRIWIEGCFQHPHLSNPLDLHHTATAGMTRAMCGLGVKRDVADQEAVRIVGGLWGLQIIAIVSPGDAIASRGLEILLSEHLDRVARLAAVNAGLAL